MSAEHFQDIQESKEFTSRVARYIEKPGTSPASSAKQFNSIAWPTSVVRPSFKVPLDAATLQNPAGRTQVVNYIREVQNRLPAMQAQLTTFISGLGTFRQKYPQINTTLGRFSAEKGFLAKFRLMEKMKNDMRTQINAYGSYNVALQQHAKLLAEIEAEAIKQGLMDDIAQQLGLFVLTMGAGNAISALRAAPAVVKWAGLMKHQKIMLMVRQKLSNRVEELNKILNIIKVVDLVSTPIQVLTR